MTSSALDATQLKVLIIESLKQQGFNIQGNRIFPPPDLDKERVRQLHQSAVQHRIEKASKNLRHYEPKLLRRIASGSEVAPERIMPRLIEVEPDSEDELLFRYVSLHWSIPVSSGYGRRLRFLVIDEQNKKLIGILGLADPVFSLKGRDEWIGWTHEQRRDHLHHVMDAFVLGAVAPYSFLLCGKLLAMLAASDEVRAAFERKYGYRQSLIRERIVDGQLALLTTTSALGRSSLYNRLKYNGRTLYHHVGFTQGSGEFHFSNGVYKAISEYTAQYCKPTAKQERWGKGFRNRREVIRKCLVQLGLSTDWLYHGVQREIFVVPLAQNAQHFLRGEESYLQPFTQSAQDLFAWFRERWLLPRAQHDLSYTTFIPSSYQLWSKNG
jgi:hypothetical protein